MTMILGNLAAFASASLSGGLSPRRAGERCFWMPAMCEPLTLGGVIIAARIIMDGPGVIAVCGAVGAGEIFHRIGEIGVGSRKPSADPV